MEQPPIRRPPPPPMPAKFAPGPTAPAPRKKTYSAPRRFGIATMLAVAAAYGVLIWLLQLINTPPGAVVFISVLLATVAGMQALFEDDPRLGSESAGVICCLGWLVYYIFAEGLDCSVICVAPLVVGLGAIVGYGGGVVVGGFFMAMENATRIVARDKENLDRDMVEGDHKRND